MKLIRHSLYNLLGLGLPLVAAVFCIPILIKELGDAKFGLLTLIWAVVSYFGLFDLGLGRSLTQLLAVALAKKEQKKVSALIGTGLAAMAGLGIIAGVLMAVFAGWGVGEINEVPDRDEALSAVLLMAVAMPAIIVTSGLRGVLEATHSFGIINAIRLPMGLFTFIAPVVVVLLGSSRLDIVAAVLVFGRVIACCVHAYFAKQVITKESGVLAFDSMLLKPLLTSGGWMTVSNVVSPFMGYIDRFVIGTMVSAAAVAFYTTPQEMITKLWIIPGALTAVLFPKFAADMADNDEQNKVLFYKAVNILFLVLFPIALFMGLFAQEILSIWINPTFSDNSTIIMQIFAAGILINCLAHVPFTLIQGVGGARLTAIIHCIELPFFLLALWVLTSNYGLLGAAAAWLSRMVLDAAMLFLFCNNLKGWPQMTMLNRNNMAYLTMGVLAFLGCGMQDLGVKIFWYVLAILIVGTVTLLKISYKKNHAV